MNNTLPSVISKIGYLFACGHIVLQQSRFLNETCDLITFGGGGGEWWDDLLHHGSVLILFRQLVSVIAHQRKRSTR